MDLKENRPTVVGSKKWLETDFTTDWFHWGQGIFRRNEGIIIAHISQSRPG
jgi:hypothetical protein